MAKLILKDEVFTNVCAAMEVHREKGCGFTEPVNQECMEIELAERKTPAGAPRQMAIFYKDRQLKKTCFVDFVAHGKIIVELKVLDPLTSREESHVINFLKFSGLEAGVLIIFGALSLEWKRVVLTNRAVESVNFQPQMNSRQFV